MLFQDWNVCKCKVIFKAPEIKWSVWSIIIDAFQSIAFEILRLRNFRNVRSRRMEMYIPASVQYVAQRVCTSNGSKYPKQKMS